MAHAATVVHTPASPLSGFFTGLFNALTRMAEANTRVQQVEALQNLSDEDLAAKGIRREDIARFVYRDVLYI